MTQATAEFNPVRLLRLRNALREQVNSVVAGSGLEVRELDRKLVIFNPRDLEKGRVYISYETVEVTRRRVTWDYLGCLDGHPGTAPHSDPRNDPDRDPDGDLIVHLRAIVAALSDRSGEDS